MGKTNIQWTQAVWNPCTGCSHVSDGCRFCYAETLSLRHGWSAKPWTAPNAAENVVLHPERLDQPLRWRKPRRIFVNSMSDLFHEQIPDHFIQSVWSVMEACRDRHTFQILTKRPERMRDFVRGHKAWFDYAAGPGVYEERHAHIWLGVSIEQDRWCNRADILRDTPAAVRFISAEPLLEPLPSLSLRGIDWLIVGGESGHAPDQRSLVEPACCPSCGAPRPDAIAHSCGYCQEYPEVRKGLSVKPWALAEARRLLDMCRYQSGETAYFLKQWGGATPRSGGNMLDGRTWEEYPEVTE